MRWLDSIMDSMDMNLSKFWTVVLEKTPESPLDCKEIQPVRLKGNQSWIFIGGTDVDAESPILWPPDSESWLIWRDPDAGKDWGQEEKGTTEDEMVWWHHWHNGHGFGWTPGVGDGQGGLVCCSSWGCKELDTTEQLNWTELYLTVSIFKCSAVLIDRQHDRTLSVIYHMHPETLEYWLSHWKALWNTLNVFDYKSLSCERYFYFNIT